MTLNITYKIIINVISFILLIFNLSLPFFESLNFNIAIFISSFLLFLTLSYDFFTKNDQHIHFYFGIFLASITLFNDFSASILYVFSFILLIYLIFIKFVSISKKLPYLVYNYMSYKIYLLIISLIIGFSLVYILNFKAYLYSLLAIFILISFIIIYNLYYYKKINNSICDVLNDFKIPILFETILKENKSYLHENTISYFSLYLSFAYFINGSYYESSHYYQKFDVKVEDYFVYYFYEILILINNNKLNKIDKVLKEYETRINLINNKLKRNFFLKNYNYLYNLINKKLFNKNLDLVVLDKNNRKYKIYDLLDDIYLNNDLSKYKKNNIILLLK